MLKKLGESGKILLLKNITHYLVRICDTSDDKNVLRSLNVKQFFNFAVFEFNRN